MPCDRKKYVRTTKGLVPLSEVSIKLTADGPFKACNNRNCAITLADSKLGRPPRPCGMQQNQLDGFLRLNQDGVLLMHHLQLTGRQVPTVDPQERRN